MWEATGKKPLELDFPDMPDAFLSTWNHYCSLDSTSFADIQAYSSVMQIKIHPRQVKLIRDINYIYESVISGKTQESILKAFNYD